MPVKPIPDGYHSVQPYVTVDGVARLIEFLQQAFDGQEIERITMEDGRIAHAEVRIGDSVVMMHDASEQMPATPSGFYLYVADTDATYRRALQAGATSIMAPADQFYGDRNGGVRDGWGNAWWIGTRIEDVPPDELQRRAAAREKEAAQKK